MPLSVEEREALKRLKEKKREEREEEKRLRETTLTVRELAEKTNLYVETVRQLCRTGVIFTISLSDSDRGLMRIPGDEAERFVQLIEQRRAETTEQAERSEFARPVASI